MRHDHDAGGALEVRSVLNIAAFMPAFDVRQPASSRASLPLQCQTLQLASPPTQPEGRGRGGRAHTVLL